MPAKHQKDQLFLSIIHKHFECEANRIADWHIESNSDALQPWIRVLNKNTALRSQGWKLHISAGVLSAQAVLHDVLPVLTAQGVTFKVVGSMQMLSSLNDARHGLSQVGKFITVYPNDDAQAIRLAAALDQATRGMRGPSIPSDCPLTHGSLVHYRYGGFGEQHVLSATGQFLPALSSPEGDLIPDQRLTVYHPPVWAIDPFIESGVATKPPEPTPLVCGRYLIVAALHRSPRGTVHLALDLETSRNCILKQALRDAQMQMDGRDARDRLRQETSLLKRLAPDRRFPSVYNLVEQGDNLFLVMEDIEGETLSEYICKMAHAGRFISSEQVITWGRELAALLDFIHAKGIVYRDLKPNNIIVATDGLLHLVDFDIAHPLTAASPPYYLGTRGYMSPQQAAGRSPEITDDIYSLGAVLYFVSTGADPGTLPNIFTPLQRPLEVMNRAIGPELAEVVARCLDNDAANRFSSMVKLDTALSGINLKAAAAVSNFRAEAARASDGRQSCYRDLARELGDTLCSVSRRDPNKDGLIWLSSHRGPSLMPLRNIYNGSAGIVLALAELVAGLGDPKHRDILAEGARWLLSPTSSLAPQSPGLYVGEAGVGVALLRAGQVLDNSSLISGAVERGCWVAAQPYKSPELIVGTAGRLRFHLLLWDQTGERECLRHAITAGKSLLTTAEEVGKGEFCWTIPPGFEGLSGYAFCGYAHGAAGIADALLDLFEVTDDERILKLAQGVGRWLARLAVPTLNDHSGIGWPTAEGGDMSLPFWCYGCTGIGQFFMHAAELGVIPEAADLASRAASTVTHGSRWGDPTQCHGLAGNIEFLLDMFQVTGNQAYLADARSLERPLEAFAAEQDNMLVWSSDSPDVFTPDYMVGYAGIALCLLRLSDPEHLPRQLSRRCFRHTPPLNHSKRGH